MRLIFSDYGIEIHEKNGQYFLNFDEGAVVSHERTVQISFEEAKIAQKSSNHAYELIVSIQNRERNE